MAGDEEPKVKRKLRIPRKFVIATLGFLVLLGGTGAAALIVGKDAILGPDEETISGVACTDVARVAIKRDDGQIWLHKYVKSDAMDGPARMKTAIRVTAGMAERLRADLIHVVVLANNGPEKRSEMRDHAIGAEVYFVREPGRIKDFDTRFKARYYTGTANADGRFFGKLKELTSEQVEMLAGAMKEKTDCINPKASTEVTTEHGKPAAGHETKPAEGEKPAGEGEAAAKHGEEAPKSGHGAEPAAAGESEIKVDMTEATFDASIGVENPEVKAKAEAEAKAEAQKKHEEELAAIEAAKNPGFFDKMMGMVGLGSAPPATEGDAAAEGHGEAAPAEGHGDAAPADGHGEAAPAEGEHAAAPAEHGDAAPAEGHDAAAAEHGDAAPAEGHDAAPAEGDAAAAEGHDTGEHLPKGAIDLRYPEKPVEEKSMFSGLMGMVGLGGDEEKPADGHGEATTAEGHDPAAAEGHGDANAAAEHGDAAPAEGHDAAASEGHDQPAADAHGEAAVDGHGEAAADGHGDAAVTDHGEAAPAEGHDAAASEGHDQPAADAHGEAAADSHGEAAVAEDHGDTAVADHADPAHATADSASHAASDVGDGSTYQQILNRISTKTPSPEGLADAGTEKLTTYQRIKLRAGGGTPASGHEAPAH